MADTLSRRANYEIRTKEAEPAILKKDDKGNIVYNQQILATTSETKDIK